MEGGHNIETFHPRPHIVERAEYKATVESEIPMLRILNNFILGFFRSMK
jgi:hypothetical protein